MKLNFVGMVDMYITFIINTENLSFACDSKKFN